MTKRTIAYYVTAHGYGHGVRTCDILAAMAARHPDVDVRIISGLGQPFFDSRLARGFCPVRHVSFDMGMVQLDAVRVDVDASLKKIQCVLADNKELIAAEIAFLEEREIGVVVSDIPGLPIAAAAQAGIPAVAVGNFSWDWIYRPFIARDEGWRAVVEQFRAEYALSDLLLRLPFSGDMSVFPVIEDVPLLASPCQSCRPEMAQALGVDEEKTWVLLSFTSLDLEAGAAARLAALGDYAFFTVPPCDWAQNGTTSVDCMRFSFQQIVGSVDVVVSKPGYGILSECIANQKPLIYVEREDFMEYPVLVESIRKYMKHSHIPLKDLYRGELEGALAEIREAAEPCEKMDAGGAVLAADRIVSFL